MIKAVSSFKNHPMKKDAVSAKHLPYLYIVAGLVAFYYSFVITVEKIALIADPSYLPSCSVSQTINCGNVMASWQASLFGFPNPLLGIIGFAIVITIGFAMLSGATFRRWFWWGAQLGMTLATIFVYWLFSQAVFSIHSLCPYCIIVWACTIPLFLYTTFYNLEAGYLVGIPVKVKPWVRVLCLALMYGVILGAILYKF